MAHAVEAVPLEEKTVPIRLRIGDMSHSSEPLREQLAALLPRLRRFARTLTRNPHDADDLVQLSIERALTRMEQFRPGTKLESWMFGIVKNAWIDEVRARGRRNRLFAPEEEGERVGVATTETQINLLSMQSAMERLPDEQRLAVALVMVEGLSYHEAADVLEVPIGTVTSRLARGRATLEAILTEHRDGTR
jgi:RNA polymerase sigma-70 factor, ECF subfamily